MCLACFVRTPASLRIHIHFLPLLLIFSLCIAFCSNLFARLFPSAVLCALCASFSFLLKVIIIKINKHLCKLLCVSASCCRRICHQSTMERLCRIILSNCACDMLVLRLLVFLVSGNWEEFADRGGLEYL